MSQDEPLNVRVNEEQLQGHSTRKHLYKNIEEELHLPVISYFTSFTKPVMIDDSDADMLESLMQKIDLSKGFALLISSAGGLGLAAERIINICRNYSGTGKYFAIVPSKAKSAATMICMGASKILMGQTSELGPIDPQITITLDNHTRNYSAHNIKQSYFKLLKQAEQTHGNLEPFLQQLSNYNPMDIEQLNSAIELSEDIAIRYFKSGMMSNMDETEIRDKIQYFLTPQITKTHGRPIYFNEAINCGLSIETLKPKTKLWENIYELYYRLNNFVNKFSSKVIEYSEASFYAGG